MFERVREAWSKGAQIETQTLGVPLHRLRYAHMAECIQRMLEEGGTDLKHYLLKDGITVIEVPKTPKEMNWLFISNPIIYSLVMQIVAHREAERERRGAADDEDTDLPHHNP